MTQTPSHNSAIASGTWTLIVFTLLHFLVDTVAGQLSPLWPALKQHYHLGAGGTFWLLLIWTMATSFSQLGIGGAIVAALIDLCDRRQSFDIAFIGFALAVIASSALCLLLPHVHQKATD